MHPTPPSRLRHHLALTLTGRGDGEGGRENPLVEPELSRIRLSMPQHSAAEPLLPGHDLLLFQRSDVWLGSTLTDHPLFTLGERLPPRQALTVEDLVQRGDRPGLFHSRFG